MKAVARGLKMGVVSVTSPLIRYSLYLLAIAIIAATWRGSFPLDDAYITLHNARALLHGSDPTYNISPLVGATSSVHLALVAALGLILSLPIASFLVGLIAAVIYAVALDRAVRNAGARDQWIIAVLVLIGLLVGTLPIQLLNGMETGMAMATVAVLFALADDRRLPFVAGIAPFVRPELAILAGMLMVRQCWGEPFMKWLHKGAQAAAVALPWLVWVWIETAHLLPATATAKVAFFAEGDDWAPLARFSVVFTALMASMLLPLFSGLIGRGIARIGALFVVSVILASAATMPGALNWNDSRYLAPLVPALLVGIATMTQERSGRIIVAICAAWTVAFLPSTLRLLDAERQWNGQQVSMLRRTGATLPAGSRVLIHDAGMIAWSSPHLRLTDAVGLKTPDSVAWHQRYTKIGCRWDRALDAIARQSQAEYAIVLQAPYWECVGTNLARAGWSMRPMNSFDGAYQLYRIKPVG